MATTPSHGYDAVKLAAIRKLSPTELEQLVDELVRFEVRVRHRQDADVVGRPDEYETGPDLGVLVRSAPRQASTEFARNVARPMTFDDAGVTTVYSVKSGAKWRTDAREEARNGSSWAVDVLRKKGHFVLVTSRKDKGEEEADPAGAKKKAQKANTLRGKGKGKASAKKTAARQTPRAPEFVKVLEDCYADRLKKKDGRRPNLTGRVRVLDAGDLLDYLKTARPALSKDLLEKLGVPNIPWLITIQEWRRVHESERGANVDYVEDAARASFRTALLASLDGVASEPGLGAIWLVSPPGVGKTRAIFEAIHARPDLEKRARVAIDVQRARAAISEHFLFEVYGDAILIVDDCQEEIRVEDVLREYELGNKRSMGRLIVVTAKDPTRVREELVPKTMARLRLGPLDDPARIKLVEAASRHSGEDPVQVARVTEGYPWFTILLARELDSDGASPAPKTLSGAVDRVLCPRSAGHVNDRSREVARRVAALFAIMITEGSVLNLRSHLGDELVVVFKDLFHDWSDMWATIGACGDIGLLRPDARGGFRYVTPAILEGEVARRVLTPTDPNSRLRFRGDRLSPALKQGLNRLLPRLEGLGLSIENLMALAMPIVQRLESGGASLSVLAQVSDTELQFAARHQPGCLVSELRRQIEATTIEDLRGDRLYRRSLVFALETTAGTRDGFDDSEAALFRLARAENEAYANNATRVWSGLFDLELNTTYRTFGERRRLLEERLSSPDADARLVALSALEALVTVHGFKSVRGAPDEPYPLPTAEEARNARALAWRLLQERMTDSSADIVEKAAKIAADHLRSALRTGVGAEASQAISASAEKLSEPQRRKLREAIAAVGEYDNAFIRAHGLEGSFERLRATLEPQSFRERLRQRVGAWGVAALRPDEDEKDRALAREGLAHPSPILEELDWLMSTDAVRSLPFAAAIGFEDSSAILLPPLLDRVRGGEDFISSYLRGHAEALRPTVVDDAIRQMRAKGEFTASALVTWRAGATPTRLAWLEEDLRARRIPDRAIELLAMASWGARLDAKEFDRFAQVLLENGEAGARTVVDMILHRMDRELASASDLDALLLVAWSKASESIPSGHFAYEWGLAVKKLISVGRCSEVLRSVVRLLTAPEYGLPRPEVVEALGAAVRADPRGAWPQIRTILERDDARNHAALWACKEAGLGQVLPETLIMEWVDHDEKRGVRVADLVSMHGPNLPGLARALVVRFGYRARPARVLATDLHSTPRAVSSLATFAEQQRSRAEAWRTDNNRQVRDFAELVVGEQERARADHAAMEEYQRRRLGS